MLFVLLLAFSAGNANGASVRTKREKLRRLQRSLKRRAGVASKEELSGLAADIAQLEQEISEGGTVREQEDQPPPQSTQDIPEGTREGLKDEIVEARTEMEMEVKVKVRSDGEAEATQPLQEQREGGVCDYIAERKANFRKDAASRNSLLTARVREFLVEADEETKTRRKSTLNDESVGQILNIENDLASLWEETSTLLRKASDPSEVKAIRKEREKKEESLMEQYGRKRNMIDVVLVGSA